MNAEELELYKKLQPVFQKHAGPIQSDDRTWWTDNGKRLFLPLPIDPVNPERGLWGMVMPSKVERQLTHGEVWYNVWCFDKTSGRHKRFDGSITLALLKALEAQEANHAD